MSELFAKLDTLENLIPSLGARDVEFAKSLISQGRQRQSLSPKQLPWVDTLIERASVSPQVQVASQDVVDGIVSLISRNNKAKYPSIRFMVGDVELKISRAGSQSRYPGTLNVILVGAENVWYGRIHLNGQFEASRKFLDKKDAVVSALRQLGQDPEKAAREYGRKTGHCCFCCLKLDDERSLLMGYGPTCARNYGLAWGDRPLAAAA